MLKSLKILNKNLNFNYKKLFSLNVLKTKTEINSEVFKVYYK